MLPKRLAESSFQSPRLPGTPGEAKNFCPVLSVLGTHRKHFEKHLEWFNHRWVLGIQEVRGAGAPFPQQASERAWGCDFNGPKLSFSPLTSSGDRAACSGEAPGGQGLVPTTIKRGKPAAL